MSETDERGGDTGGESEDDTRDVVTAFLRTRGEILLLCRSDAVGTYTERWGGVSGYAEGDPDEQVRVEITEETGLESEAVSLVRSGGPVRVRDETVGQTWRVHPYLFDSESRAIELSEEHTDSEWVSATAILEEDRETVPGLWAAYERVAPSVRSIAADDEHGAAWLSVRGLEVLRDRAGLLVGERATETSVSDATDDETEDATDDQTEDEWDELTTLATSLLEARPSMAVLRNRVNRAMAERDGQDAASVLESAISGIERALEADSDAAANASEYVSGRILTLSRSGTVWDALQAGEPDRVFVAESRPGCEGVDVAESLADDTTVTLHTDSAIAHVLAREAIDRVLVGADTLLPDGRVVNKIGTRGTALAAAHDGIPVFVVAASDKLSTRETVNLESGARTAVYDGEAPFDVVNPIFDVTPTDCLEGVITEDGVRSTDELESVASTLEGFEDW